MTEGKTAPLRSLLYLLFKILEGKRITSRGKLTGKPFASRQPLRKSDESKLVAPNWGEFAANRSAKVRPGQRVLIHGAAGGVGSALLQLGRLAGLKMYGTCSSRGASAVSDLDGTPN
jgi:hypothetical protein